MMSDIKPSKTFEGWHNRETYMAMVKLDNEQYLFTAVNQILLESASFPGSDFDRLRHIAKRMRATFEPVHLEYGGKVRWHELAGHLIKNRLPELLEATP